MVAGYAMTPIRATKCGQERRWSAGPVLTDRTIDRMESMAIRPLPDQATLLKPLRYEPDTGKLFWRTRSPDLFGDGLLSKERACAAWNGHYAGKLALNTDRGNGYMFGLIFGEQHSAHRVIWAMVTGDWPTLSVDHINGKKTDNRWRNLRLATILEQSQNKALNRLNRFGTPGVFREADSKRYRARITVSGKRMNLGTFDTIEDAAFARKAAERRYGFHPNHGRRTSK